MPSPNRSRSVFLTKGEGLESRSGSRAGDGLRHTLLVTDPEPKLR